MPIRPHEAHFVNRIGWLRAAVLGANDGIVSVASLIVGVASATGTQKAVLVAGVASWIAGAMSMAAGEYVSVSSQSDSEKADLERERVELADNPHGEHLELASIYVQRGLQPKLAQEVASQLMAKDALGSHARDELGISDATAARPIQAALASAASFTAGAALPLLVALLVPRGLLLPGVIVASVVFLAVLGAIAARTGGAKVGKAMLRVSFWGLLAMAVTAGVGRLVGAATG